MNNQKGITLLTLVITVILLLIITFAGMNAFNSNIIKDSEDIGKASQIEAMKTEIKIAIIKETAIKDDEVTLEEIIGNLEKNEIIKTRK